MDNYFSNHFAWSNSLKKTETHPVFSAPHIKVELGRSSTNKIWLARIRFRPAQWKCQRDGSVC